MEESEMKSFILIAALLSLPFFSSSTLAQETEAIAMIHPTEGNSCTGSVRFTQIGEQVRIIAEVDGLTPNAQHGFHIHQYGDASLSNGTSAGGHYNPAGTPHALPDEFNRHAGDLGNLQADQNGHAVLELETPHLSIDGPLNPIIGRGVIVHAKPDDGGQPTGNAGARIGIGVIGIAKPVE
jgi:superoxide dismutase, Cu-Zn family